MANEEHVTLLKQGVESWNRWREEHPEISPDLSYTNLNGKVLANINLSNTDLTGSSLFDAYLNNAILTRATLINATLIAAYFSNVMLNEAELSYANLLGATLTEANLTGAILFGTNFTQAILTGANLTNAQVMFTTFADIDMRTVQGLETVEHYAPSTIGIDTLIHSEGQIPQVFLRKAGIPDTFIEYSHSLIAHPIDYYTCFISYSSKDQEFVERLYADLQSKGVRCWFAPEDLKTGDIIRDRIDQSIRLHDKLLLVLSEHSVNSSWVRLEVEAAFAKEDKRNITTMFPIRIDDAVKQSTTSWADHIRRTRHITDFSNWKQHDAYQKGLKRLLRDLKPETPQVAKQE